MGHLTLIIFAVLTTRCVYLDGAHSDNAERAEFFKTIDELINRDTLEDLDEAKRLLQEMSEKSGDTSPLLWRLASYYFHFMNRNKDLPQNEKQALLEKGVEYAQKALKLNELDPDAHKWYGLLVAAKGQLMGLSDKVLGASTFKKHIDLAVQLRPEDPSIHHVIGIFEYEVGKLPWLQRNMARAVIKDFPNATVDDAIKSFLRADEYSKKPWKLNYVYLVKCYLHKRQFSNAKIWLDVAERVPIQTPEDEKAAAKIVELRKELPV